jgi:sulfur carrier protein
MTEVQGLIIIVNGKEITLAEGTTISELITQKGLNPETLVIEHNYELVKKEVWSSIVLHAQDTVEILSFVGGG